MKESLKHIGEILTKPENAALLPFTAEEWNEILHEANQGGVAPLIYWNLSALGKISALPEFIRRTLRSAYSQSWKQNQIIFGELEILAQEFNRAGIPVVLLKGACFALTIYPDMGARPMGDLDLLVPAAQVGEAVRIAKSLGYIDDTPAASLGLRELLEHEICLRKNGARAMILEIHKSLAANAVFDFAVPPDWFWTQTQPLHQARFPNLQILTPPAQLLYASAHAMLQHGGGSSPLRWFVDIDLLIRFYGEEIRWEELLAQAKIFEWGSALRAALTRTREYFHTPIPEFVFTELSKQADRFAGRVKELDKKPMTRTQVELQKMKALNAYGRMRLLFALVIPSPAYMRQRYNLKTSWGLLAYYPLRWMQLFADGTRALLIIARKYSHITHL